MMSINNIHRFNIEMLPVLPQLPYLPNTTLHHVSCDVCVPLVHIYTIFRGNRGNKYRVPNGGAGIKMLPVFLFRGNNR
jgi:hypothetical protein